MCIGGPLVDAGYTVKLIDNDLYGLPFPRLVEEIAELKTVVDLVTAWEQGRGLEAVAGISWRRGVDWPRYKMFGFSPVAGLQFSHGRSTQPSAIIQTDMAKWTYRNQVIATSFMKPLALFLAVKLTEILNHLRPRALLRLWQVKDHRSSPALNKRCS